MHLPKICVCRKGILAGLFLAGGRGPSPSWRDFQDSRAVYHDDVQDYSTHEPTLDGTVIAILMWIVFKGGCLRSAGSDQAEVT